MNMLDIQDKLKGLSEQQLVQAMQAPSENVPQFLVLSEITRRKRMRDSMAAQESNGMTVAQEAVAAAGVPQGGISDMARAMAPNTDMVQNTGASPVQGMYGGGYVQKMFDGGIAALRSNPAALAYAQKEAQRLGMSLEQYVAQMPQAESDAYDRFLSTKNERNRMLGLEPPMSLATDVELQGVNPSYREQTTSVFPDDTAGPVGGFATPSQSLYPPVPVGNPIPGEEPSYYAPPKREEPMSPMERIRFLQGPSFEGEGRGDVFDAREPEMQLGYNMATGKFENVPTLGQQMENIGEGIANIPGAVSDFVSGLELPDVGNPYSELTDEELSALSSGRISPEAADSLQAARMAMQRYGGRTPAPAQQAAPKPEETDTQTTPEVAPAEKKPPAGDLIADTGAGTSGVRTGGTRTAGGAGSASGMTSYEQELINAMQRAERRANQDKWLALAQVGLNLMSSTQPTLGGALGEAGLAGLESYRGARDAYEQERLGFVKELSGIESARASQRAAATKASSGPSLSDIDSYIKSLTTEVTGYDDSGMEVTRRVAINEDDRALVTQLEAQRAAMIRNRIAPQM